MLRSTRTDSARPPRTRGDSAPHTGRLVRLGHGVSLGSPLGGAVKSSDYPITNSMRWHVSYRADPRGRVIADRHYTRQKVGSGQFVAPGRCLVLLTSCASSLWVTSWPFPEFVKHEWAGAWICSSFRREGPGLASEMIREAVAATRTYFGEPPTLGMVTFVNPKKVRHKRDPGRCFVKAGFRRLKTTTKGGLLVFQMLHDEMPAACPAIDQQLALGIA